PGMRRDVGALGLVAEVAQVALLDDLAVVGLVNAVDFHGGTFVHQVEQGGEGLAQADAAAAAVAQVEDALELLLQRGLVPEFRSLPVQRMPRRCPQAAFTGSGRRTRHAASLGSEAGAAGTRGRQ